MKKVSIDAYEDRAHPGGGYAVICLHGLTSISDESTFVMKPVDIAEGSSDYGRWPHGSQIPVETRVTPLGVEMIVGPDLVDNPLLLPGTAVRIDLPQDAVGGEFLWPSVAPLVRPRRKSVFANRRFGETMPVGATATPVVATQPMAGKSGDGPERSPRVDAGDPVASPGAESAAVDKTAAAAAVSFERATVKAAAAAPDVAAPPVFYQSARRGRVDTDGVDTATAHAPVRTLTDLIPQTRRGVAIATVAGLLALQSTAYLLFAPRAQPGLAVAPVQADNVPVSAAGAGSGPIPTHLYEALLAGPVSPSGKAATSIAPAKALELANASLFADGAARDTDEAAFWLKRYLLGAVGDDRVRRVLTQLGTTYAAPTRGAPSYARARQTWEIAAAFGDPQAMCFIAVLYENGLGGPGDKASAQQWQQRAKEAGGCANTAGGLAKP